VKILPSSLLLAAATTGAILWGCEDQDPGPPPAPAAGVILEVDGLRVMRQEVEDWYAYVESYQPTAGRMQAIAYFIETHLLPLRAAERDFPEARARALDKAHGLQSVAGNSLELQDKGPGLPEYVPATNYSRTDLEPAVVDYAFALENLGRVSEPIATPRGFVLAASIDMIPGGTTFSDRVRLCRADFWMSGDQEYFDWIRDLRSRLEGKVTYLDPDFRHAVPDWLLP
jgi:hypothetical protein